MSEFRDRRSPFFVGVFRRYLGWKLKRSLDGIHVEGLPAAKLLTSRSSIIFAANHVAFWDPLVILALDDAMKTRGYAVMDAGNLERLPFFAWLGAVPLDRTSLGGIRSGLRNASAVLRRANTPLWFFPQGKHRPAHVRPMAPLAGLWSLRCESDAPVVPVTIDYRFRDAPEPAVFVRFGSPLDSSELTSKRRLLEEVERQWIDGLGCIDRFQLDGVGEFETLIPPRMSSPATGIGVRLLRLLSGSSKERSR